MPRGKLDINVTKNLQESGFFQDERSYVGLDGHLYLEGWDKSTVRKKIFKRFRNRCAICRHLLHVTAEPFQDKCGAWHHPTACDCAGCAELRCDQSTGRPCHAHRVAGIGFDRDAEKMKAKQQFKTLYPEGAK